VTGCVVRIFLTVADREFRTLGFQGIAGVHASREAGSSLAFGLSQVRGGVLLPASYFWKFFCWEGICLPLE